jgi:hypothetical protein
MFVPNVDPAPVPDSPVNVAEVPHYVTDREILEDLHRLALNNSLDIARTFDAVAALSKKVDALEAMLPKIVDAIQTQLALSPAGRTVLKLLGVS